MKDTPVAVIGAGVAGLACARRLRAAGATVSVYDKGRGPGGRAATRHALGTAFDHGAQYFTVRDPSFATALGLPAAGGAIAPFVARWGEGEPLGEPLLVGVPGMSVLGRVLAGETVVHSACRIVALEATAAGWCLKDEKGARHGPYARVAVAIPAPQARELAGLPRALGAPLAGVLMQPCLALLATYASSIDAAFDVDWRADAVLPFVCRNSAKPGRDPGEAWVLHADGDWSARHDQEAERNLGAVLLETFARRIGRTLPAPSGTLLHRWRHARVTVPLGEPCLYDAPSGIGLCGDWCIAARIEAAFQSGDALAGRILAPP